ncbi:SusC/RagA family TonB-linked outer membrane protein [Seonamhaeicola algicola]|uniref:SusC/RagA family TonB-linked outer membrane protein n=1 Tax=Seonamhaeicola algicola TaxID=1719036 RepID=A0A5C7ALW5_9FLAO|nr:SusC/RagA family TonB-linked outer membrane protein [Seonamhaeicola algicola]TXE09710.1 SusC/RagA family TonB-linked outer membrane protein [Seonamhaeicola algicola]
MTITIPNHLIKKLITVTLFLCCLNGFSQNKKLTLNYNKEPLSNILKYIEKETNYRFIYNTKKIDGSKKISVSTENKTLTETLKALFINTNIAFIINNNQVLLTTKNTQTNAITPQQIQERLVKGTVKSTADNFPLPGATIKIKGTAKGAITNLDGQFTYLLKGADISNTIFEVSYLGMKTQDVLVGNQSNFTIYLKEDADNLEQVVITTSYGTEKLKEEVVGSISTINANDIPKEQAVESIDKMIEGQMAGVLVENTSGVGTPVKINIRGQGSLSPLGNAVLGTSTQPLIIIDGIILTEESGIDSSFFDGSGSFAEDLSNPLAQISPENIESISVLKDAAAVSIYGADGANGVIIITTKKGKLGSPKFEFSTQLGISSAINQIQYLNGEQYHELRNEYLKNTSIGYTPTPYNGVNTNWFDLLNNTGVFKSYNFNVSGATETFSYRTSISYKDIEEPQLGNNTKQLNGSINLGYKKNKFDVSVALNPSYIKKDAPNIYYSYAFVPTLSPYNEDGSYANVGVLGLGNPLAAIEQNKNVANTYSMLGSLRAAYQISSAIKVSSLFGLSYSNKDQDRYFSGANESGRFSGTFTLNGITYPNWGMRLLNERNTTKWNWQGQASFNKQINEHHNIDGILGIELAEDKVDFNYTSGRGFTKPNVVNPISNAIRDDNPSTPSDETFDSQSFKDDISYNSRVSYFSQINYNYKKRYFFLGNFRRDESSVFGDDTNIAYNGGAGISWIASNENFLSNSSWINFLKLKLSYGTTGNSRIGSYRSKGLYNIFDFGYNGTPYATPSTAPNGNLSWEKNTKFNAGIDFNVFNTVNLSVEYYHDDITDLITSRNIPSETGYTSVQLNAASMYNKGLEVSTRVKWINSEKFKWSTSFNISTLNSEVTDLVGLGDAFSTSERALAQKIGHSTSTIWGINWVGIDPATGRDLLEKDGQIYDAATYNSLFDADDWVPIGDSQPDAFGGFSNTISINNSIDFSVRASFQIGGDYLAQDELISKYNITSNRNLSVNAYDYWRQQGDVALQPVVTSNNPPLSNLSKHLYDATYLKINNINLRYRFPHNSIPFLKTLSAFIDVSNVAYWYKDKSPSNRNGIREFRFTYPQARTISFGINGKF